MDKLEQQSPIKLIKAEAIYSPFSKRFFDYDYSAAPFKGTFEGKPGHRNFVLQRSGKKRPTIKLGDLKAELVKIHLHMPSEHDIEGQNRDGEIHLIHEIAKPTSASSLIVLGVFFSKSKGAKRYDFWEAWSATSAQEVEIDPNKLLPKTKRWYRYEGSLTSDPYTENVSWLVFDKPLSIASEDLKKLQLEAEQPERPTQPINRRFVLRNFK
jgi:carbonic anhydrase